MSWASGVPPIPILHQDEDLVVADKPGGLLVHRSKESSDRVVLLQELRRQLARYLYPVHRLDRAASGAIVFAFSSEVAAALQEHLRAEDARKEYLVLVRGECDAAGTIDRPLTDDSGVSRQARTDYELVASFFRLSLLRVRIATGRRHQIRRHLAHVRHQVIGDTSYGKGKINRFFREEYGLPRLFLHASRLEFRHPRREERVVAHAPLAKDLREFLSRLPGAEAVEVS